MDSYLEANSVPAFVETCQLCGATARLSGGSCVNCLLQLGLQEKEPTRYRQLPDAKSHVADDPRAESLF